LAGNNEIDYPAPMSTSRTFKKAPKAKKRGHEAMDLFGEERHPKKSLASLPESG